MQRTCTTVTFQPGERSAVFYPSFCPLGVDVGTPLSHLHGFYLPEARRCPQMEDQDRQEVQEPLEIDPVLPSSEAAWKHLTTGRSVFFHVEDTHPTALGYSLSLSCLLFPLMIQEGVRKRYCIRIGPRDNLEVTPSLRLGLPFGLGVWEKKKTRNQPVCRSHSDSTQHGG